MYNNYYDNQDFNPIQSVDGRAIPCPSTYTFDLMDISSSDAGRTEDINMDKKRIGQCRKLEFSWKGLDLETIHQVLVAFQPEYVQVVYLDPLAGGYRKSEFYVGDRVAPMYNAQCNLWERLTLNLIERGGRDVFD